MTQMDSFHALHRSGFGPAPGEMRAVASDPRAWVAAQIGPTPAPPRLAGFAGSDDQDQSLQVTHFRAFLKCLAMLHQARFLKSRNPIFPKQLGVVANLTLFADVFNGEP